MIDYSFRQEFYCLFDGIKLKNRFRFLSKDFLVLNRIENIDNKRYLFLLNGLYSATKLKRNRLLRILFPRNKFRFKRALFAPN
ncbi:hypothetical protein SAMN06298214_0913 [Bacteroidales bacterium WCE2004]|nr:hypothetical protein SAMN06298214_0913 [Bacteroidales bacterium WCE2004]